MRKSAYQFYENCQNIHRAKTPFDKDSFGQLNSIKSCFSLISYPELTLRDFDLPAVRKLLRALANVAVRTSAENIFQDFKVYWLDAKISRSGGNRQTTNFRLRVTGK